MLAASTVALDNHWGSSLELAGALFASTPGSTTTTAAAASRNKLGEIGKAQSAWWSAVEFETKLKTEPAFRDRVLHLLKTTHSSESVYCLLEVLQWLDPTTSNSNNNKKEHASRIIDEFIAPNAPREIFIDPVLRANMLANRSQGKSNTASFEELKRFILVDLRFNPVLSIM